MSPKWLKDKFTSVVSPIWEQKKNISNEIAALTALRDSLLPLLMNGQVTVNSD